MEWEDEFYEDGVAISKRITDTIPHVAPEDVANIAIEAREMMKLRHVPLLVVREMARLPEHKKLVRKTLAKVIQRPDELAEFLAIYWKDGKQPLSAQVKKGLAAAFTKFDEYQLAKWDKAGTIKLRDVLFLCHAKPKDKNQEDLWERLVKEQLKTPDTWEVALSSGGDKRAHWERLLKENRLGGLAFLRNLRNMEKAEVNFRLVNEAAKKINFSRVLPFRFLTAAKHVPGQEHLVEECLYQCCASRPKLPGKTILIVDVSGSMYGSSISKYSEMTRDRVACALAVLIRELCEEPRIYATAGSDARRTHKTKIVPARRGFALSDYIYGQCHPLGGGGIFLKQVMDYVYDREKSADRVIVITDEQDCDNKNSGAPQKANAFGRINYLLNVASYDRGIGYGKWVHINGWSDAVIDYMLKFEEVVYSNQQSIYRNGGSL